MTRAQALSCLGGSFPNAPPPAVEVLEVRDRGDHRAELLRYDIAGEPIGTAWALIPADLDSGERRPGVAVWHQHNDEYHLGKGESAGFDGNPMHHTGVDLVREGFVVLCPDALGFEDRRHPRMDGAAYERHLAMAFLSRGRSLAWANIRDCRRAVDVLADRPEADPDRIGCYGHSLGSTLSWLTAPWEERLRCVVGNCCMPSMAAVEEAEINHSFSNYIPGIRLYGDIPAYVALAAPRRLHLNFGAADPLNPVGPLRDDLERVAEGYAAAGAAGAFSAFIDDEAGHELSEPMKRRMLAVFREAL